MTVNALGQTATSTDRNGTVHTLAYDVLGRVTADAVTTLGSGVDGAVRRIETAYDGQGNPYLVTSYSAASGGSVVNQVQRGYNGLGQLTAEWQAHSGAVNTSTTPAVTYTYSEMPSGANHSRLTAVTYPSGYSVGYSYASGLDATIGRLSALTDTSGTLEAYSYLGLGTVVVRSHPQPDLDLTYLKRSGESNGDAGDQYTGLDRFGRVVDQRWVDGSSGTATDRFQYGYDRVGNRLYRDNLVNSAFGEVYTYDGLNQLASFDRGTLNAGKTAVTGTPARSQDWDYDAAGNWDGIDVDGVTQSRTANAQNEVTSIGSLTTPTYDANGNMTRAETGLRYVYDAWNRLVTVKDSAGTTTLETLGYDGLNRRVAATAGGTTTDLYYSAGWQVVEERVGGAATSRYVWSPVYVDALVMRDRDTDANGSLDERLWVTQDANWNVTAVVDGNGVVGERFVYDPFGAATIYSPTYGTVRTASSYAWQYTFQGLRVDGVTGNLYARSRDYTPTLGRWTQIDPIRFNGKDVNLYRAFSNSPLNFTDPTGEVVYTTGAGGTFVFVAGGSLSAFYAWDDCGNYGYFIGASPQFGFSGGIGGEGGVYSGDLNEFANGFTLNATINISIFTIGGDWGVRGSGSGGHGGIGFGAGGSVGASFSGLLRNMPHVMGKKCPQCPRLDLYLVPPESRANNTGSLDEFASPGTLPTPVKPWWQFW